MSFLLDTNACIAIIKERASVVDRFRRETRAGAHIFYSAIAAFELYYGVAKSQRKHGNDLSVKIFLGGTVSPIDFEVEDAKIAGGIRATLESAGTPIGMYDLLIAGQALRHGLTLVTANEREFSRVPGLRWENWA
jgi:tRNA(fMet)-specific endonuclease VapC